MPFDVELAFRFTIWSTTFLTAIITGHWAYLHPTYRIPTLGLCAKAMGWTIHQGYWFFSWLSFEAKNETLYQAIREYRWIVGSSEVLIIIATVFVISPYIRSFPGIIGKFWIWFGVLFVASVFAFGWGMAYLWQQ